MDAFDNQKKMQKSPLSLPAKIEEASSSNHGTSLPRDHPDRSRPRIEEEAPKRDGFLPREQLARQELPHVRYDKRAALKRVEHRSEDINDCADDFIKRFRQQLHIQRMESIENYHQMLSRGL